MCRYSICGFHLVVHQCLCKRRTFLLQCFMVQPFWLTLQPLKSRTSCSWHILLLHGSAMFMTCHKLRHGHRIAAFSMLKSKKTGKELFFIISSQSSKSKSCSHRREHNVCLLVTKTDCRQQRS